MPKKTTAPEPMPITGYRPRPRSDWFTCDAIEAEEGGEPFKARLRTHLTFGEIDQIPYGVGVKYHEIEEAIAPYVLDWNVMAVNAETGEAEKVPPPAEAGIDAFKVVGGFEVEWMAIQLRKSYLGAVEEAGEDLKKSGSTPGKSAGASSS